MTTKFKEVVKMLKEMKKQLGWLVFGVPKKKPTTVYYYNGKPFITSRNGTLHFHQSRPKRKPRQ